MSNFNIPFHKPYITEEETDQVVEALKSVWITENLD